MTRSQAITTRSKSRALASRKTPRKSMDGSSDTPLPSGAFHTLNGQLAGLKDFLQSYHVRCEKIKKDREPYAGDFSLIDFALEVQLKPYTALGSAKLKSKQPTEVDVALADFFGFLENTFRRLEQDTGLGHGLTVKELYDRYGDDDDVAQQFVEQIKANKKRGQITPNDPTKMLEKLLLFSGVYQNMRRPTHVANTLVTISRPPAQAAPPTPGKNNAATAGPNTEGTNTQSPKTKSDNINVPSPDTDDTKADVSSEGTPVRLPSPRTVSPPPEAKSGDERDESMPQPMGGAKNDIAEFGLEDADENGFLDGILAGISDDLEEDDEDDEEKEADEEGPKTASNAVPPSPGTMKMGELLEAWESELESFEGVAMDTAPETISSDDLKKKSFPSKADVQNLLATLTTILGQRDAILGPEASTNISAETKARAHLVFAKVHSKLGSWTEVKAELAAIDQSALGDRLGSFFRAQICFLVASGEPWERVVDVYKSWQVESPDDSPKNIEILRQFYKVALNKDDILFDRKGSRAALLNAGAVLGTSVVLFTLFEEAKAVLVLSEHLVDAETQDVDKLLEHFEGLICNYYQVCKIRGFGTEVDKIVHGSTQEAGQLQDFLASDDTQGRYVPDDATKCFLRLLSCIGSFPPQENIANMPRLIKLYLRGLVMNAKAYHSPSTRGAITVLTMLICDYESTEAADWAFEEMQRLTQTVTNSQRADLLVSGDPGAPLPNQERWQSSKDSFQSSLSLSFVWDEVLGVPNPPKIKMAVLESSVRGAIAVCCVELGQVKEAALSFEEALGCDLRNIKALRCMAKFIQEGNLGFNELKRLAITRNLYLQCIKAFRLMRRPERSDFNQFVEVVGLLKMTFDVLKNIASNHAPLEENLVLCGYHYFPEDDASFRKETINQLVNLHSDKFTKFVPLGSKEEVRRFQADLTDMRQHVSLARKNASTLLKRKEAETANNE